jgi:hypothetical protein
MTSLVDLVDEAREDPLRLGLGVRASRYGLAQVHRIFGDWVGAGVEGDPERPDGRGSMRPFDRCGFAFSFGMLGIMGPGRTTTRTRRCSGRQKPGSEWPLMTWGFGWSCLSESNRRPSHYEKVVGVASALCQRSW